MSALPLGSSEPTPGSLQSHQTNVGLRTLVVLKLGDLIIASPWYSLGYLRILSYIVVLFITMPGNAKECAVQVDNMPFFYHTPLGPLLFDVGQAMMDSPPQKSSSDDCWSPLPPNRSSHIIRPRSESCIADFRRPKIEERS